MINFRSHTALPRSRTLLQLAFVLSVAGALVFSGVLPLHAAATTQTSTSIISSSSNIVASSQPVAAIGLNIAADAAETLDSVAVTITDTGTANIDMSDFANLGTTETSGFALYVDDAATGLNGTWDGADDLASITGVTNDGLKVTIDVNALTLPANDTGANVGADYFIVFRTSPSIAEGDDFTLSLAAAGDVVYSTGASGGMTTVTTATVTADRTAPLITGRATADIDNDGQIDAIDLTTSEPLADDFGGSLAGDVSGYTGESFAVEGTGATPNDNAFRIRFTESGSADTSVTPTFQLTNGGFIRDRALGGTATDAAGGNRAGGNLMQAEGSATTSTDAAKPVLMSVDIDDFLDGVTHNAIEFSYSESVQYSSDGVTFATEDVLSSSATMGGMTTARTVVGFATFNGTSDVTTDSAGGNSVQGNGGATITIWFNENNAAYFSTATIAPSTDTFTPLSDVDAVKDLAGNAVNASGPTRVATVSTAWDITPPTLSAVYSCDSDDDGDINQFQLNWSEDIRDIVSTVRYAQFEGDNDTTNAGDSSEETASSASTSTGGCDGLVADSTSNDQKISIYLTNGITGTDTAYVNFTVSAVHDHAGNRAVAADNAGTETDMAGPVIVSVSPTDGATNVSVDDDIVLTFSEGMVTTAGQLTYSFTGGSTTFTEAWSASGTYGADAVVTLTPNAAMSKGSHTLTILTAPGADTNDYVGMSPAAVSGSYNFSIPRSSDDDGVSTTVGAGTSYAVAVTSPAAGEALTPGSVEAITWTASEGGVMTYADIVLSYVDENGNTVQSTIVSNTANDGAYTWTVPNVSSSSATITVTGTDLVTALATGTSGTFSIGDNGVGGEAPSSGEEGVSPVTGETEAISVVDYGDYIKSPSYATVYYVDRNDAGELVRRPFMDAQTFFTWQDGFMNVSIVTDATLPTLSLGSPMLPKAGVVLVKIQSVNKVYAVEGDGELRWITSEDVAVGMYGADWADYVIDIPDTLFPRFERGEDIGHVEAVDTGAMKTREEVNS